MRPLVHPSLALLYSANGSPRNGGGEVDSLVVPVVFTVKENSPSTMPPRSKLANLEFREKIGKNRNEKGETSTLIL